MKLTLHAPLTRSWLTAGHYRLWAAGTAVTLAAGLTGFATYAAPGASRPAATSRAAVSGTAIPASPGLAAVGPAGQTGTAAAATQQLTPVSLVTLVTGDRARLTTGPGGQQTVTPAGQGRPESPVFVPLRYAGDEYLFPATAVPYLGTVLDPRLFDVSYLARARLDDTHSATVPVAVSYSGAGVPAVPGLHVSQAAHGTATGTIAKAQAAVLGALLARQHATVAARHAAPASPLPGLTRITLAPPAGAPALPPAPFQAPSAAPGSGMAGPAAAGRPSAGLPYRALRLEFTGPSASTAFALGFVQNVGDSQLDSSLGVGALAFGGVELSLTGGRYTWQVSVPAGTYSAEFVFLTPHAGTALGFDAALVADPQFTVGSGPTTVRLDARLAVPYSAPMPGITAPPVRLDLLDVGRSPASGPIVSGGFSLGLVSLSGDGYTGSVLSAVPTARVTEGNFSFDASSTLEQVAQFSGGPPSPSPVYMLDFPSQGQIPSSLAYTVAQAKLTPIHTRAYQASSGAFSATYPPGPSDCGEVGAYDSVGFRLNDGSPSLGALGGSLQMPDGSGRTDYLYENNPRISLLQPEFGSDDCSFRSGVPQQVEPGQQITQTWNKEPLVPGPALEPATDSPDLTNYPASPLPAPCTACRQDDNAFVSLTDWGDSDPGHYATYPGYFVPADNYALWSQAFNQMSFYREGTLALTSKGTCAVAFGSGGSAGCSMSPQGLDLPLLPQPASYRLDWSYPRGGDPAAITDTTWRFTSARDPGRPLPTDEECAPDPTRGCAFLPLLFLTYDLPLNLANQALAGGQFPVTFTVAHQAGQAPPSRVTATVSASFDDGQTWTTPVTANAQGDDRFTATIAQPPLSSTSGFASLRVTATDAAGNTVTQTIIRAYGLTS